MNITAAEFAVITLTGIAAGWLWTSPDARVLEPLRRRINDRLRSAGPVGRYFLTGSECAVCVGFWPQLVITGNTTGWGSWTLPLALSAMMLHVAWQLISGVAAAVILR